jgi:outer membrane protein assembly factor BamA
MVWLRFHIVCWFLFLFWIQIFIVTGQIQNKPYQIIITINLEHTDTLEIEGLAQTKLSELHQTGFLDAILDSIVVSPSEYFIYIKPGKEYFYVTEKTEILQSSLTGNPGIFISDKPVSFVEFEKSTNDIFNFYAQNGRPFSRIEKKDLRINDSLIFLTLVIDPGDAFVFDSIKIQGNTRLNPFFLENITGIKVGKPYNEILAGDVQNRISELNFVELTSAIELRFAPGKATLVVPLKKTNANRFDGMAGLSGGSGSDTPLQINGILNLYLSNAIGLGEFLDLRWQGPGNGTQLLGIKGGYPYPFRLPIETEFSFSLHKQDSSWIQSEFRPTFFVNINSKSKFGAFWLYSDNSVLNTKLLENISRLPEILDFTLNQYGVEYRYSTRAFFRQLLKNGYFIRMNASAGLHKININTSIPQELYKNINREKSQITIFALLEKRWKTGPRATLSLETESAYISGKTFPKINSSAWEDLIH